MNRFIIAIIQYYAEHMLFIFVETKGESRWKKKWKKLKLVLCL